MTSIAVCGTFRNEWEYAESTDVFEAFGDDERRRIESISSSRSRELSLGALIALKHLTDQFGIVGSLDIKRGDNGKPYFKDSPYFFNLSHSYDFSVAVLSDKPVGIDIEHMISKNSLHKIAKRFFSEEEYILYRESGESAEEFYRIWTAKEAVVKYKGASLALSLSEDDKKDKDLFLKSFIFTHSEERYIITVCLPNAEEVDISSINEDINLES